MADSASPTPNRVVPLERVAPVYVETRNGYVDIQQLQGDPTLYTPEEARELARELEAAADDAERGTGGS